MGRFQGNRGGRNAGRGLAGRGGRSSNYNRNKNNSSTSKSSAVKIKKTLADHVYYVGSAKQASDYVTTTNFIINHIKKQYDHGEDIAFALENLNERDLTKFQPMLKRATPADPKDARAVAQEETLNEQYKMQFQVDYDKYKERVEAYRDNKFKAYALLWGQCNSAMKAKIQSRKDYQTVIKDNPIELLKAIKQHATNFSDIQYDMRTAEDAMTSFMTIRQRDDESLIDFLRRYKNTKDVFLSHIGKDFTLPSMVRQHPDYPDEIDLNSDVSTVREAARGKAEELAKQVLERFIAYRYLKAVDQTKYGSVISGLNSQFSLGNDQYPKTLTDAHNVISAHRWDPEYKKKTQKKKEDNSKRYNDKDKDKAPELSFAQMKNECYCCGKNHKLPDCPDRWKTPKDEWHINKNKAAKKYQNMVANINKTMQQDVKDGRAPAQVHTQQQSATQSVTMPATVTDEQSMVEREEWQFACLAHVGYDLSNSLLLDSCSSEHLMCNKDMVSNIRLAPKQLDMASNGGNIITKHQADMTKAGQVWYNENAIANILSLGKLADKFRITFDSAVDNAFHIHTDQGIIKFKKNAANLYEHRPSTIKKSGTTDQAIIPYNHVQTVEENMKMYTPRQIQQAKAARDLLASLGTPSIQDMKTAITTNSIRNVPITVKDIEIAEQIFGPDLGTLKGKTTRRKPLPMVTDQVAIPPELYTAQQNVDLCIDIMFVNEMPFLTSISKRIMYRTAQFLPTRTAEDLRSAIDAIFRIYNDAGFTITNVYCDNEFKPLFDEVKDDLDITMHYSGPDEHVPESERNNRTLKERTRATYHRLPYKALPKTFIRRLVSESARKLNYFPSKHGISAHYSPRMILHREILDYDKHCKYGLGDYVQAHKILTPSNRQDPRTIDGIYLRPVANGHEVYSLATQAIFTAARVTRQPITPAVIRAVEAIAEAQNQKGLRIRTKKGGTLYDSSWTAGVDYDEYDEEADEDYTPPEEEEEDDELTGVEEEENDPNTIGEILEDNIIQQDPAHEESDDEEQNDDEQSNNDQNNDNRQENEQLDEEDIDEEERDEVQESASARPTRSRKPNKVFSPKMTGKSHDQQTHIMVDESQATEYDKDVAQYAANFLTALQNRVIRSKPKPTKKGNSFLVTYSLKKGLEKFKDKGYQAARGEMEQLHDRKCWQPIKPEELQGSERKKALESLIFLVEKKSGKVKARHCANGSVQRKWMDEDKTSSPTVMTESVLLSATIDAEERRDVATMDIPNAFIQTEVEETDEDGDRIIMKIRGAMVDMLLEIDPDQYAPYVMFENGQKVLYVHIIRAIYGMLLSAILFYKKFRKSIEAIGFKINPYDPCVANRMINGNQHTIMWHVDDLKSSVKDPRVNDRFAKWLNDQYGKEKEVTVTRGHKHVYLGMLLDYATPGEVKVNMIEYIEDMIDEFPSDLPGKTNNPNNDKLFKVEASKRLEPLKADAFHTFVAKSLFLTKRARPDILPTVAFLCTRVKESTYQDWTKLTRLMDFLKTTKNDCLTLKADNSHHVIWSIDAAFAVHPDMKSHSGAIMTLGKGAIQSMSKKQKLNTRSSTESELIAVDDGMSQVLWTKHFLEAQGYKINNHIIHQDNESAIKLERNGPKSIGKRSRHINIRYFFITDQIEKGNVEVRYCPTDDMEGDYMTKPLQGAKFHKFRKFIMNLKD